MKKKIIAVLISVLALGGLLAPVASATEWNETLIPSNTSACDAALRENPALANDPNFNAICGDAKSENDARAVVKSVLSTVFIWLGIIAVIVIIIGGVLYMTAQGDTTKIATAKKAILYAVIGLIVALLSFAIVNFILGKL